MSAVGHRARWLASGATLFALTGSACSHALPATRRLGFESRLASPEAVRARTLAPDLYARATRALEDARHARDLDAERDHVARAELLLAAAIAEAGRLASERQAAVLEDQAARARERRAALARERIELERAEKRVVEGRAARARAVAALGPAPSEELTRGAPAEAAREQRAAQIRSRAALLFAAAIALGLDQEHQGTCAAALAAAERPGPSKTRLSAARAALEAAETALGQARAARPTPPPETLAALLELGQERGLAPIATSEGVAIALDPVFPAASLRPSPAGAWLLGALGALARAHPHGRIAIQALLPGSAPAAERRAAEVRAELVRTSLARSTDASRIALAPIASGSEAAEAGRPVKSGARVLFLAYAASAPAPPGR